VTAARREGQAKPVNDVGLQSLLEYLKRNRGFDFTGYKRNSLERRIGKRMQEVGIGSYEEYQDHLEVTPDEFTDLFDTILINVTDFYRDKPAWTYLSEEVVPQILDGAPAPEPIRVWSAACATGEEAYTLAMILAEAVGEADFRRRVKIYGTDVDEDALAKARHGTYPRNSLKPLPSGHAEKYFEHGLSGYTFRADLRRSVIFGRNDLVQDAPISRIDLLVSRNALMYFTPETQARILGHFNFALKDTGFLFLGKSEMLITHKDLFRAHDLKRRVFRKVPRLGLRDRLAFLPEGSTLHAPEPEVGYSELRGGALDAAPVAVVLVDSGGVVTGINQEAQGLFDLSSADVGRPFDDLQVSYRPMDLRTALAQAESDRAPVHLGRVGWTRRQGEVATLEIEVRPLLGNGGPALGVAFYFSDVTHAAHIDAEYERSKRELETAYAEIQSTVEELETTNEELHSTNEELETTNEELQSSNEELETMNEELQSTNDELEAMNEDQSVRGAELDKVNMFLEGILGSLGISVVVLDADRRVQVWNANSTEIWGLRADEVQGQAFLGLDIGLPVEQLGDSIRNVLAGDAETLEQEVEAVTRRGRSVKCRVRMLPLRRPDGKVYGAIILMALGDQALVGA
jgi:two-component system, chemotaxis family, CheB/CheR fusion protein